MSRFIARLKIDCLMPAELGKSRTPLYTLLEDFVYESDLLGRLVAPVGMITDFASIPRIAWRYIDPNDAGVADPSVIHDYLYTLAGVLPDGRKYTREQADLVLREAMGACGARADQRAVVYSAVRLFGGTHWNPTAP